MSTLPIPTPRTTSATKAPPPLENGDRLTRPEFERRFDSMPGLKKAELVEGIVYMPPSVSGVYHARPHALVTMWLGTYELHTPGSVSFVEGTLRLSLVDEPQPDAALIIAPEWGGQATFDDEGYLTKAPDLVAEVSAS